MFEGLNGETRLFPIIGDPVIYAKSPERLSRGFARRSHNGDLRSDAGAGRGPGGRVARHVASSQHRRPARHDAAQVCRPCLLRIMVRAGATPESRERHAPQSRGLLAWRYARWPRLREGAEGRRARPEGARVLLLGAGGAGSAIAVALLEAGVRELIVHDPDEARASQSIALLASLGPGQHNRRPTGADRMRHGVQRNADGHGHRGSAPRFSADLLAVSMFVGDVVAGHGVTPSLRAARAAGMPDGGWRSDGRGRPGDDGSISSSALDASRLADRIVWAVGRSLPNDGHLRAGAGPSCHDEQEVRGGPPQAGAGRLSVRRTASRQPA